MTNPSIRRYFPLDRPRLILWINICQHTMNILSNRSLTYRGEQILWCFLRVWRADISVLSQVRILYVMKRKTVQTKYDVPVRRAFRWASEQKFCEAELHEIFRIPAPWLTKEIIFVCTVFLLFTLWMTCERTLIHAQLRCELHHRICNLRYGTHGYGMSAYKER